MSDGACISLRTHFISSIILVCQRFLTPRPPSAIGRQTSLHLTLARPRVPSVYAPCQKKFLMMASMCLQTPAGTLNTDIKYVGMAESTAFSSTRRPPQDKSQALQPPNWCSLSPQLAASSVISASLPLGEVLGTG